MSEKTREDDRQIGQANSFLKNEQKQLSPDYLARLRDDGSVEARDELREIAEEYNVSYDNATTTHELVDRITLRMEQEADNDQI